MIRIKFNNCAEAEDVYAAALRDYRCAVLTLTMTHNRLYQVPLACIGVSSRYPNDVLEMKFGQILSVRTDPVEVPDDCATFKAQLAARDAALDAVLTLALNDPNMRCDSPNESALRHKFVNTLAAYGVK